MAAAHREGLAHLRLTPGAVLRTDRPVPHPRPRRRTPRCAASARDSPQRTDTEAIGALLYAALTQRWPYENDAYGLTGLPKGVGLIAARPGAGGRPPRAVRARHARPRQRRRHRLPAGAALHHPGGAGQGGRGDAPHPARRSPPSRLRPSTSARPTSRAPTAARPAAPGARATQPVPAPPPPAAEPHRQGAEVGRRRRCSSPRWAWAAGSSRTRSSTAATSPDDTGHLTDGRRQDGRRRPAGQAAADRRCQGVRRRAARPRHPSSRSHERRTTATPDTVLDHPAATQGCAELRQPARRASASVVDLGSARTSAASRSTVLQRAHDRGAARRSRRDASDADVALAPSRSASPAIRGRKQPEGDARPSRCRPATC